MNEAKKYREKYPDIEPYNTGFMDTGDGHKIYFEESGNPKGKPVVFLHGGPGAGASPGHRSYFHPEKYRIVIFDQRGSGRSEPFASLENNGTWDLVADMEKLREKLGIQKWQVFGGSWGSTLALAYAIEHPERVSELVLRGIFLCRKKDIDWFYQSGASEVFPDEWENYVRPIPPAERGNMVENYYKRLCSPNQEIRQTAAKAWSMWEGATYKLIPAADALTDFSGDRFALSLARIECHYFINGSFFDTDNWLIENASKIKDIPGVIIHGRYDMICPMDQAWTLHKAWPKGELQIIQDAGHAASEPGITDALVRATDRFAGI